MDTIIKNFKSNINETYTEFIDNINTIINDKENSIKKLNEEISEYKMKLKTLIKQYKLLNEECENFQKVSIVKNLNTQLFEKENMIKFLNKKIETLKKQNIKMNINDVKIKTTETTIEADVCDTEDDEKNVKGNVNEEVGINVEVGENEEVSINVEVDKNEVVEVGENEDEDKSEVVEVGENEDEDKSEVVEVGENEDEDKSEDGFEHVTGGDVTENSEEIEEVEFYEKRLKSPVTKKMTMYYITDDTNKEIYEKLEDDEIGECIGKLVGKNTRPHFY